MNAGYVGSGNDTGHVGGNCEPGVNTDGTYNLQFINDFIRNGMKQQILLSKRVAATYYGTRAGLQLLERLLHRRPPGLRAGAGTAAGELDGILANAPAIYWTRFQTAQMWGQIVMKDLVGGPIAAAKLSQATASAVAACDGDDGVVDGVIDEPRACTFSAKANICGAPRRAGRQLPQRAPRPKRSTASGTARATPTASASGSAWTAARRSTR